MSRLIKTMLFALVPSLLLLEACSAEPEVITANPADPDADKLAAALPVELPPAIAASRTYRCRDNSLLYADFYTDNTVRIRTGSDQKAVVLASIEGHSGFEGQGYSLSSNAERVSFTDPARGSLSCKA